MNLVRKLKINKITSVEFTEKDKEIIEFVNSILDDLTPFKYDNYPESMFYFKGSKWFLEQDDKHDVLRIRYDGFWEPLENMYSIKYIDIQILLKYMVELSFKEKVSTPRVLTDVDIIQVEQSFKNKVSTPLKNFLHNPEQVEQAFEKKISIPREQLIPPTIEVEEAYNKKKL